MDFQLTSEQQHLQNKCRELASDFATRTAAHDREASHPVENSGATGRSFPCSAELWGKKNSPCQRVLSSFVCRSKS